MLSTPPKEAVNDKIHVRCFCNQQYCKRCQYCDDLFSYLGFLHLMVQQNIKTQITYDILAQKSLPQYRFSIVTTKSKT